MAGGKKVVVVAMILLLLTHQVASIDYILCSTGILSTGKVIYGALKTPKKMRSFDWILEFSSAAGYLYYCLPGSEEEKSNWVFRLHNHHYSIKKILFVNQPLFNHEITTISNFSILYIK